MPVRDIYLGPERSAIPWQLDPDAPALTELARGFRAVRPETPCDPRDVLADLDVLEALLQDRHFGIATGLVPGDAALQAVDACRARVARKRSATLGEAWGPLADELRLALRDRHVHLTGSLPSRIRSTEPASVDTDGPVVEETRHGDVLVVRLRRFFGDPAEEDALQEWSDAWEQTFQHERIILDLRGNPGGNDGYVVDWAAHVTPGLAELPVTDAAWVCDDRPTSLWNTAVLTAAATGRESVPRWLTKSMHQPSPNDLETVQVSDVEPVPPGERPWHGRMMVVVDARSASSAESSALVLRHLLGATVVGRPTYGSIEYGNMCPYLLPSTGAAVQLGTKHNDFGVPVEVGGCPVDVPLDPATPAEELAREFDRILGAADGRTG